MEIITPNYSDQWYRDKVLNGRLGKSPDNAVNQISSTLSLTGTVRSWEGKMKVVVLGGFGLRSIFRLRIKSLNVEWIYYAIYGTK